MRHPRTHQSLGWLLPALLMCAGAVVGLILTAATIWDGVAKWAEAQFLAWWPVVTGGWFLFFAAAGLAIYLAAWAYTGSDGQPPPVPEEVEESPIKIHPGLAIDAVSVEDPEGNPIAGLVAVALCLQVTNALKSGKSLKNLQARFHHLTGDIDALPIRGAADGVTDLRHGEIATIEVGRVLARDTLLVFTRRKEFYRVENMTAVNHLLGADAPARSPWIAISSARGESEISLRQLSPERKFTHMPITISADDTISRSVMLQTNLYDDHPLRWLEFVWDYGLAETF